MDILCKLCHRLIIENPSEFQEYLATLRKTDDEGLYEKYTINNINFDEVDRILNENVTIHNKKFYNHLISCEFVLEFDNNFTAKIETKYFYNIDFINIKRYLLYDICNFTSRGYKL